MCCENKTGKETTCNLHMMLAVKVQREGDNENEGGNDE
jgi:hypothetical protein